MKALWRYNTGTQAYRELEEPQIRDATDVKIKVAYNTIGIQDMRMSRAWDFYAKPGIAGYEMAGKIVELGKKAKELGFYRGQRVSGTIVDFCGDCYYCRQQMENYCLNLRIHAGTLCDFVIWKAKQIIPIPKDMSYKIGTLIEPVAVVAMAAEKLELEGKDRLCIFGGDFNGLVLLQLAKRKKKDTSVTVIEPKAFNREMAKRMGADLVIDPAEDDYMTELMAYTDFLGYQAVAVTSSNPKWISSAINLTGSGGKIVFTVYYDYGKDIAVNSVKLFRMGIEVTSSLLYTREILEKTPKIMEDLILDPLVVREYAFKEALDAFDLEKKEWFPRIGIKSHL